MDPIRIEIWTISIGGHPNAARAIQQALDLTASYRVKIRIRDIFSPCLMPQLLSRTINVYKDVVNYVPSLWGIIFGISSHPFLLSVLRTAIATIMNELLIRELQEWKPHLIVTVCPTLGQLRFVGRLRENQRFNSTVITIVTDPVIVHSSWVAPEVDYYIVPTEEAYSYCCTKLKVPQARIRLVGFPVEFKFSQNIFPSKPEIRRLLDLNDEQFTVLMVGGSSGAGGIQKYVQTLVESNIDVQLVVICGHNHKLYDHLKSVQYMVRDTWKGRLIVQSWVDNLNLFMRASDIIATKAGPTTTTEAMNMQLPIIYYWATPGQEARNIEYYAHRLGIALVALSPEQFAREIRRVLCSSETLSEIRHRQAELSKPDAALEIARILLRFI